MIAVLLKRMETQWDEAQEASDGKKLEIKKVSQICGLTMYTT